jgi:hypothetical protein
MPSVAIPSLAANDSFKIRTVLLFISTEKITGFDYKHFYSCILPLKQNKVTLKPELCLETCRAIATWHDVTAS